MSKARQYAAGWTVLALAAVFALPACDRVTAVDSPQQGVSTQLNSSKAENCPSIEEMTIRIVNELLANCPGATSYKNWGDENSCTQRTMGKTLNSYKSCFNGAEMKDIRARVRASLASRGTGRPSGEPNPEQE